MVARSNSRRAETDTSLDTKQPVRIKKASYVRDYVLEFTFTNGTVREIDLEPYLWGPMFERVRQPDYFRKFRIRREDRTIAWPNDADIDPDVLYLGLTSASREPAQAVDS